MTEDEDDERDSISFSTGLCVSCGKRTSSALVALVAEDEEPQHEGFVLGAAFGGSKQSRG